MVETTTLLPVTGQLPVRDASTATAPLRPVDEATVVSSQRPGHLPSRDHSMIHTDIPTRLLRVFVFVMGVVAAVMVGMVISVYFGG